PGKTPSDRCSSDEHFDCVLNLLPGSTQGPVLGTREHTSYCKGEGGRWVFVVCLFLSDALTGGVSGQEVDLIYTDSLCSRGVVFETRGLGLDSLGTGTGLGDFTGDGFSDLFIWGLDVGIADGLHDPILFSVVFGRRGLTGRHLLGDPLLG